MVGTCPLHPHRQSSSSLCPPGLGAISGAITAPRPHPQTPPPGAGLQPMDSGHACLGNERQPPLPHCSLCGAFSLFPLESRLSCICNWKEKVHMIALDKCVRSNCVCRLLRSPLPTAASPPTWPLLEVVCPCGRKRSLFTPGLSFCAAGTNRPKSELKAAQTHCSSVGQSPALS